MASFVSTVNNYFTSKISSEKKNIWKTLFLLRKAYLSKYFNHYYSQFGEDIILKDWILKHINKGFYVDVGCYHPRKFSNTYRLYKRGWRGINIDLDPLKIGTFNLLRTEDCNINAAVSDSEKKVNVFYNGLYSLTSTIDENLASNSDDAEQIDTSTLDSIIKKTPYANRQIDLLSIDAEGHDFNVLKSLSFDVYKPKIIIIESHARRFDQILTSDVYVYLVEHGYEFINWVGFSLFFALPENDILKFKVESTS